MGLLMCCGVWDVWLREKHVGQVEAWNFVGAVLEARDVFGHDCSNEFFARHVKFECVKKPTSEIVPEPGEDL